MFSPLGFFLFGFIFFEGGGERGGGREEGAGFINKEVLNFRIQYLSGFIILFFSGHAQIVHLLLERNKFGTIPSDSQGATPLHYAAQSNFAVSSTYLNVK